LAAWRPLKLLQLKGAGTRADTGQAQPGSARPSTHDRRSPPGCRAARVCSRGAGAHDQPQGVPYQAREISRSLVPQCATEVRSELVDGQPVANGIQPARPRPRPMIDRAHAPESRHALWLQMIEAGKRAVLD